MVLPGSQSASSMAVTELMPEAETRQSSAPSSAAIFSSHACRRSKTIKARVGDGQARQPPKPVRDGFACGIPLKGMFGAVFLLDCFSQSQLKL